MPNQQAYRLGRTLITVSFIMILVQSSITSSPFSAVSILTAAAGIALIRVGSS